MNKMDIHKEESKIIPGRRKKKYEYKYNDKIV